MKPRYLSCSKEDFTSKIEKLYEILSSCSLCGHECHVNRLKGETGVCNSTDKIKISSTLPHFGEERVLVGKNGSGTIFLSNCCLTCVFCQNYEISQKGKGREVEPKELADKMLDLQNRGCENINWVSPTHYAPQLIKSLRIAKDRGLEIPIVYNTGGYDNPDLLEILDGLVDIYLVDMKYGSNQPGEKYSGAIDYWDLNKKAVKEIHRQVRDLKTENGIARRGLMVRHLVLPNNIADSEKILKFIVREISKETYVNIMDQYRPEFEARNISNLSRRVNDIEFREVLDKARELGLSRGF